MNSVDKVSRKMPLLVGIFLLYPMSEGGGKLASLYLDCPYARSIWILFLQEVDVSLACQRNVCMMIGEFLLHLPFREKERFLWGAGLCAVTWDFWSEINSKMFRSVERDPSEVWSLVKFHVSL